MEPREFHELAELLSADDGPFPAARHRTSISRCYYSAFLQARKRLTGELGWRINSRQAHSVVMKAFARSGDKTGKVVGQLLDQLRQLRQVADYDIDQRHPDVREALRISVQINAKLPVVDVTTCYNDRA